MAPDVVGPSDKEIADFCDARIGRSLLFNCRTQVVAHTVGQVLDIQWLLPIYRPPVKRQLVFWHYHKSSGKQLASPLVLEQSAVFGPIDSSHHLDKRGEPPV